MKKRTIWIVVGCLAGYLILLAALLYAESFSAETSINSLPKAIWFSFVTLTTVGYGDMYPVTIAGKLIGAVFLLLSLGALAAVIGLAVSYITGTGLPSLRIRRSGKKNVYIIDRDDASSGALAVNILHENPAAVLIFPGQDSTAALDDRNRIYIRLGTQEVLKLLTKAAGHVTVVFTGADAAERFAQIRLPAGVKAVCESALEPEELSDSIRFFDRDKLCASMYWQNIPLGKSEKKVVLVGFGRLSRALLEQALESGILSPVRTVAYHVYGDGSDFLGDHRQLGYSVSIGAESPDRDSLIFHQESWNAGAELLSDADRIIFASDDCAENMERYQRLLQYCTTAAKVHFYCSGSLDSNLPAFGTDSEIYTPENLLRTQVEALARNMHEIYRSESGGDPWEKLSPFLRRSNLAAAEHIAEKLRYLLDDDSLTSFTPEQMNEACRRFIRLRDAGDDTCRRIEHDRWVRFHAMYNWKYASVRDNSRRLHPLMVPFESLSEADRAKDDYAYLIIGSLAKKEDANGQAI